MNLVRYMRYWFRRLLRRPVAFTVALLTITLGIGASSAVFNVLQAVLFHQFAFSQPERLVVVTNFEKLNTLEGGSFYKSARGLATLDSVAEYQQSSANLMFQSLVERASLAEVSAGFFSTLGAAPILGRDFLPEEDQPGHDLVCVISYELWKELFGGDVSAIGQAIHLNGIPFTIVGIMPFGTFFPGQSKLWVPTMFDSNAYVREGNALNVSALGRVRKGADLARVREELTRIVEQDANGSALSDESRPQVVPLIAELTGKLRPVLTMLNAAVSFVLLIVTANVGYFVLLDATARAREVQLRIALGASTWRIVSEELSESLILAFSGGVLGTVVSAGLTICLYRWGPQGLLPYKGNLTPLIVGLYATGAVLFVGVVAGLFPVWFVIRHSSKASISLESGQQISAGRGLTAKIVTGETVLALALLIITCGSLSSLSELNHATFAYDTHGLLTFSLSPHGPRYVDFSHHSVDVKAVDSLYEQALTNLESLPTVAGVAATSRSPIAENSDDVLPVALEGKSVTPVSGLEYIVSPKYFQTMGLRVIEGQLPLRVELQMEKLAVVSADFAQQLWKTESAVGKRLNLPIHGPIQFRVIAVVADSYLNRQRASAAPAIYLFLNQVYSPSATFILRTKYSPTTLLPLVKNVLATIAPDQPLFAVLTLDQRIGTVEENQRFAIAVLTGFTAIAILLAIGGLYSAVSINQHLRVREIGIRMALGADRRNVVWIMLLDGCKIVIPGIVIGTIGGFIALHAASAVLFGFSALSLTTIGLIAVIFAFTALVPTVWPAKRAADVDPADLLRAQ